MTPATHARMAAYAAMVRIETGAAQDGQAPDALVASGTCRRSVWGSHHPIGRCSQGGGELSQLLSS